MQLACRGQLTFCHKTTLTTTTNRATSNTHLMKKPQMPPHPHPNHKGMIKNHQSIHHRLTQVHLLTQSPLLLNPLLRTHPQKGWGLSHHWHTPQNPHQILAPSNPSILHPPNHHLIPPVSLHQLHRTSQTQTIPSPLPFTSLAILTAVLPKMHPLTHLQHQLQLPSHHL